MTRFRPFLASVMLATLLIAASPLWIHAEENHWMIDAGDSLKVGLLDMDTEEMSPRYREQFTSMLRANLELSGIFDILEPGTIQSLLQQKGLSLPKHDYANNRVAGEIGRMAGVDYMITGAIERVGASYSVVVRLIHSANDSTVLSARVENIGPLATDVDPAIARAVAMLVEKAAEPVLPEKFVRGPLSKMVFARIEAGSFMMGSAQGDKSEQPVHKVEVDAFELMTTEVTQAMWDEVMEENPSKFKGPDQPVERMTYKEIRRFIVALNIKDPDHQYRLPSEAEWEYAARAGTTTEFPFGDDAVGLDYFAWFKENSEGTTHAAAQKEANGFGLFDMLGNVFELCVDTWYDDYEGAPSSSAARLDRSRPEAPRVLRGGSYASSAGNCSPATRIAHKPGKRNDYAGFRLARTPLN